MTGTKIKNWFKKGSELLGKNNSILEEPNQIFNMDKTCFSLASKIELNIGAREQNFYDKHPFTNSDRENVTTLFGTNALVNIGK